MAVPRVSQQFVEVIRSIGAAPPAVLVTQQFAENVRGDIAVIQPRAFVTQQFVELIRADASRGGLSLLPLMGAG